MERDKGANGGIIAIVKSNMGVIYRIRGNVKEAEVLHTQALTFFNESYDLWARAREHCNLGLIYKINKEWEKALIMFNSALELEDQTMNERGKSIQLSNIGQIMMETGKYDRAEVYFNDSMEISKKLNDAKGQSYQYKNLARLYNLTERKDRAIEYISKSKQIDEQGKNQFEVAKCLEIMGEILQTEKGRILEAKKYFEEAKSIFVQLKMMNYADKVELGLENLRLLVA
jgi:tetratricopeptide (TPR) repeat protein